MRIIEMPMDIQKRLGLLGLMAALLASYPVHAGAAAEEKAVSDKAVKPVVDKPLEAGEPSLARVPAPDESIYVAQKRAYSKRGHFELTPIFGATINNRYTSTMGIMLGATYHLRENFGIELIGGYTGSGLSSFTEATNEIRDRASLEGPTAERKWMQYFVGLDAQFAPFYGKLRMIPGILGDYDLYLAVGFGLVGTETPCANGREYSSDGRGLVENGLGVQGVRGLCPASPAKAVLPADMRFAGTFGAGFRIFFLSWLGVRLEVRDIVYSELVNELKPTNGGQQQQEISTFIRHQMFFLFGVSFLL